MGSLYGANLDNLYMGIGYEQQAIGQFWKMGFEAVKLNADFGFDILVHNLKNRVLDGGKSTKNYYFQVKSRQCKNKDFGFRQTNEGLIQVKFAYLGIEEEYLELLKNESSSYLLCYFYDPNSQTLDSVITSFWLNSRNLNWIINDGRFHWNYEDQTYLSFQILYNADLRQNLDLIRHGIVEKIGLDESKDLLRLLHELYEKADIINHQFNKKVVLLPNKANKNIDDMHILKDQFFDIARFTEADYDDFDNNPLDTMEYKELNVDEELMENLRDCIMKDISNEAMGIYY